MANPLGLLIDNVTALVSRFLDAASVGPVSAILVLCAAAIVFFAVLLFGYLTVGAIGSLLTPDSLHRTPPRGEQ